MQKWTFVLHLRPPKALISNFSNNITAYEEKRNHDQESSKTNIQIDLQTFLRVEL